MPKICPLYKHAMIKGYVNLGLPTKDANIDDACLCDRENCALWVPSMIQPEKYGSCGLKNTRKG